MPPASSLTNRIFIACMLLAMLSLGFAFSFVNARASTEVEAELRRGLVDAGRLVDQHSATRTDYFTRLARVVADLPKLKAAVETGDAPTVQPLADQYRAEVGADLLVLTGRRSDVLGSAGAEASAVPAALQKVRSLEEISTFTSHDRGVLQLVSVPILLEGDIPEILGRLTVGFFLDNRLAEELKGLTGSEIAFGAGGRILASTLPADARSTLESFIGASEIATASIGEDEYVVLARPLLAATPGASSASDGGTAPVALVLRSRTERLQFLNAIRTGLAGVLIVTLLLATLLSYGVALTMTRPLAAITTAMREIAATGDLTRKIVLKSRAWDDEDARLLASAFNTLTESIARFQHDAAQKDRLSSLGRLSTVIAHEIRNPLMIIRASLATLRRDHVNALELREAVSDIDDETTRLNRIVTEVLDFARPIRFELADTDLNQVCRASAEAAWTGQLSSAVAFDFDPALPLVMTDAERLRTALVNVLTNARYAVLAAAKSGSAEPQSAVAVAEGSGVRLSTRAADGRVIISIRDRGIGIAPEDMAHIFDPYFTTRRAGTGLGLPIAKNIIEGLGGSITVQSRRGEGTDIRIELPHTPPDIHA
jgi:signal transduction histidine kinase